jgi:hypothetical protein
VEYKKWKNLNKVSYRGSIIPKNMKSRTTDEDRILKKHFVNQLTHSNYYTSRVDEFIKNKPLKNKDMKISQRLTRQNKKENDIKFEWNKKRLNDLWKWKKFNR